MATYSVECAVELRRVMPSVTRTTGWVIPRGGERDRAPSVRQGHLPQQRVFDISEAVRSFPGGRIRVLSFVVIVLVVIVVVIVVVVVVVANRVKSVRRS